MQNSNGGILAVPVRAKVVLVMMFLLVLLNYGFMQVRIASIPLAELIMLFYLITANAPLLLARFGYTVNQFPFIAWWAYGISSAMYYYSINDIWALRDASHILESIYILVGFSVFSSRAVRDVIINGYPKILLILTLYALTYPFSQQLREFSPILVAGAGQPVPLLFNYSNSSLLLMLSVAYLAIGHLNSGIIRKSAGPIAAFIVIFSIGFYQSRILYIHLIVVLLILLIHKPSIFYRLIYVVLVSVFLLGLISVLEINISGRLEQVLDISFIQNHFMTIFGQQSDGLVGAAKGIPLRLGWWSDILSAWSSDLLTMMLGLGYGFPLVDFQVGHGVMVREPHNSYLSVLARAGVIGFVLWLWMHWYLLRSWYFAYVECKKRGWQLGTDFLVIVLIYFLLIWLRSFVQDGFEKPFIAVSYYFFWGVVLRIYWYSKHSKINEYGIN